MYVVLEASYIQRNIVNAQLKVNASGCLFIYYLLLFLDFDEAFKPSFFNYVTIQSF